MVMSKKCINCGAELDDDQLFCDECGIKLVTESQMPKETEKVSSSISTDISDANKSEFMQTQDDAKTRSKTEILEKAKKQEERKSNLKHFAIISLILGIVSYISILTIVVPIITSIIGIVFGFKGLKSDMKKTSFAGIIINISFLILFAAIIIFA